MRSPLVLRQRSPPHRTFISPPRQAKVPPKRVVSPSPSTTTLSEAVYQPKSVMVDIIPVALAAHEGYVSGLHKSGTMNDKLLVLCTNTDQDKVFLPELDFLKATLSETQHSVNGIQKDAPH